jgi:hypothetical protein
MLQHHPPTHPIENHRSTMESLHILPSINITAPSLHYCFHQFESQFFTRRKGKKTEIEESIGVNVVEKMPGICRTNMRRGYLVE